jgi:surfeit locus 1 family protein
VKRFPIGLTVAAALGLAVLLGLGVWQLKRLAWKQDQLARIAALRHAPPRPVSDVLAVATRGKDVAFERVAADCAPAAGGGPGIFRYALRDGQVGWRVMAFCRLAGAPWTGIALDRGLVDRLAGQMSPTAESFPAPSRVVGVLRRPGRHTLIDAPPRRGPDGAMILQSVDPATLRLIAGGAHPAPYYLAVESETPPPPGVTPAALPQDIPNNHFVYALTWFGLAGVLVWTWASYVWRRMRAS